MKKVIDGIIVVEGTNDISHLSSYVRATFVALNGFATKNIEFLKQASKTRTIYLLTDSDSSGETIRERVKAIIPNCIDLRVDVNSCNRKGKHGVCECEKKEIYRVLSPYFTEIERGENKEKLSAISQMVSLSEHPNELRSYICERLGIENCNNKTFINRVSALDIKKEELLDIIKDFYNGN